jgi:hypothetical protein
MYALDQLHLATAEFWAKWAGANRQTGLRHAQSGIRESSKLG